MSDCAIPQVQDDTCHGYHVYIPTAIVDFHYLDLLVRSEPFKVEILRHSKGVWLSKLRLYPEEFMNIRFPIPPLDEQRAAVEFYRRRVERDNRLRNEINGSLDLLRERRSALITAAVTGQIPIREMAK